MSPITNTPNYILLLLQVTQLCLPSQTNQTTYFCKYGYLRNVSHHNTPNCILLLSQVPHFCLPSQTHQTTHFCYYRYKSYVCHHKHTKLHTSVIAGTSVMSPTQTYYILLLLQVTQWCLPSQTHQTTYFCYYRYLSYICHHKHFKPIDTPIFFWLLACFHHMLSY